MALVGAGLGIEHHDPAIAIAVGDVKFAGGLIGDMWAGLPSWVVLFEPPLGFDPSGMTY
jgi:hypothetical protein